MQYFYALCAGIATGAALVALFFIVRTLEELRLTVQQARRTAQAVEQLALHLDQNVEAVGGMTQRLYEFTDGLKSGWMRALQVLVGIASTLRERWTEPEPSKEREAASAGREPAAPRNPAERRV